MPDTTPAPSSDPAADHTPKSKREGDEYRRCKEQFKNKQHSVYFDPCQEAAERSIRCLNRNQGDRDMCKDYFQAYRDCKKRWMDQWKDEKRKNTAW